MTDRVVMLNGTRVFRVHWKPGSDKLVGVCHCGAEHEFEAPVELWDWLLAHPEGHGHAPELAGRPLMPRPAVSHT